MKNLTDLQDECISHILSLTSPVDVIRSSAVSKQLLTISNTNAVWDKFLPSDGHQIFMNSEWSTLGQRFAYSNKAIFSHLSDSYLLFNNETQSFSLDKWTGKKSYMVGSRSLVIIWGDHQQYWAWKHVPESRFPESAKLRIVCWLDITGRINTRLLSPNTTYGAYFVFKLKVNSRGFEQNPVNIFMSKLYESEPSESETYQGNVALKSVYLKAPNTRRGRRKRHRDEVLVPVTRDDGWMEVEMGRYYVNNDVDDERMVLEMKIEEVDDYVGKSGLLIQGIEVRPLD